MLKVVSEDNTTDSCMLIVVILSKNNPELRDIRVKCLA